MGAVTPRPVGALYRCPVSSSHSRVVLPSPLGRRTEIRLATASSPASGLSGDKSSAQIVVCTYFDRVDCAK